MALLLGRFLGRLSCACLLLTVATTAVPALGSEPRSDERELRRELRRRGVDPDEVVLPHSLSPEMKEWLAASLPEGGSEAERLDRLLQLLVAESQLDLQYRRGHTGTAIETFATRKANCLAFTHLFVGMAREAGLNAYFVEVEDLESFERAGDLVVVSGHVTAGFGPDRAPHILEFTAFPVAEYRHVRRLSDLSAVALFYSNRGAELLLAGDREGAARWLELAVAIDETLADAWLNLGVVRRRQGDPDGAEGAYWRALEIDPDLTSAYQNLSALLIGQEDRAEEARRLLALTDRDANRNPFNYLALGDVSLRQGRLEDARRYYRRALDLLPKAAEARAAMGLWYLEAGQLDRAKKWLRRARKSNPEAPRVQRLAHLVAAVPTADG